MTQRKITGSGIADDAITSDNIAAGVVSASDVADGTLTAAKLDASTNAILNDVANKADTTTVNTALAGKQSILVAGTDYLTPTGDASQLTNLPAGYTDSDVATYLSGNNITVGGLTLPTSASAPTNPSAGQIYVDTDSDTAYIYIDGGWRAATAPAINLGTYTTDSLYSYWDMSSPESWPGSGSTLYDLQGNQDLTNSGDAPSIQNSGTAEQYALQTSGDYPYWTASNRNYGVGTVTIEAWVTTTGRVGDDYIFNFYSGGSGQQSRALRMDGSVTNGLSFVGNGSSGQDQNGLYSFSVNTWYQVVFAIDSYDNLSVYVNGSLIGNYTKDLSDGGGGGVTLGNTFWNGADNTSDFWRGGWALARFYTKKLNATEVAANWNGTKSRFGY